MTTDEKSPAKSPQDPLARRLEDLCARDPEARNRRHALPGTVLTRE